MYRDEAAQPLGCEKGCFDFVAVRLKWLSGWTRATRDRETPPVTRFDWGNTFVLFTARKVCCEQLTMGTMMRFICLSRGTSEVRLSKLKLTQPGMLWPDHRSAHSAALRTRRQSPGIKSSVPPSLPCALPSPRADVSLVPCGPLSMLRFYSPAGRARPLTRTPVALASSSAASARTSDEPLKARAVQTPTTVPLDDVKRILRLAHPERWRLAGKQCAHCL